MIEGENTMDVRTLKVGQKLYVRIGPRTMYGGTVEDMEEMNGPYFERRINLTKWDNIWDGSYNLPRGSFIAFDAATGKEIGSYGLSADGWSSCPVDADLILVEEYREGRLVNGVILKKSKRDGGGFGTFRTMTLEEAKALPRHAYIWVWMTSVAQRFKTYDPGIDQYNRFRLDIDIGCIPEKEILGGMVLVEVEEETK
ncbi:MAG: hypothetical protein WB558_13555 [Terriglobales bacterium]